MNLNSCEIRRLNIRSSFNRRCCRCCLASVRLPAVLTICLFGCLAYVYGGFFVVCRLSKHLSAVHLDVIVCARDIRLLFKLLLKFWNVLKHTEAPFVVIKISKKTSQQRWRFSFALKRKETKRNDIYVNRSFTKTSTQRASNFRGRTGYNV